MSSTSVVDDHEDARPLQALAVMGLDAPNGCPQDAPEALRTMLALAHRSPMPMLIWWGPERIQFFNQAWARLWKNQALMPQGQSGPGCWGSAWAQLGGHIDHVHQTGQAVWCDNTPLPRPPLAPDSDLFATYSFNPIESQGRTEGVLFMCSRSYHAHAVQADGRFGYAAIIHRLDVGFAIVEMLPQARPADFRFLEVNQAFEQQTGLQNPVGKRLSELLPDHDGVWASLWTQVAATGEPLRLEREAQELGRIFDLFAMRLGGPDSLQVAVLYKDITAAKRAEAALQRSEQALKEAHERKDEFLAMLAHELRNPLAPISAAAELMSRTDADQPLLRSTSAIIARQVRHMTGLVDDLLDMSRVSRGLIKLDRQVLDANTIAQEAVEQVTPLIQSRRHQLTLTLLPEPACVNGDRKRLVQVLSNLLSNAAKYTPDGGKIALTARANASAVELLVRDNGQGMNAATLRSAFELFAQAERSSDREQGGLGIGLALVRRLVDLHGGQVRGHSEGLGRGSEFAVTLERVHTPAPVSQGSCAPQPGSPRAGLHVMVVDDHVDAALTLCMLVEACGHQCVTAHRPEEALKLSAKLPPDVFILDIGLPGMDGKELARRLRAQPSTKEATLIALSGYAQPEDQRAALDAGFDHYFVKPMDVSRLTEMLDGLASRLPDRR